MMMFIYLCRCHVASMSTLDGDVMLGVTCDWNLDGSSSCHFILFGKLGKEILHPSLNIKTFIKK